MNSMESVRAVLKHGIRGTLYRSGLNFPVFQERKIHENPNTISIYASGKYFHRYLNETAFCLNQGNVRNRLMNGTVSFCSGNIDRAFPYAKLTDENT